MTERSLLFLGLLAMTLMVVAAIAHALAPLLEQLARLFA